MAAGNVRTAVRSVQILPWAFTAPPVLRDIRWEAILMDWENVIKPLALRENI